MPRGGRRSGRPGVAYANRSDLTAQPVRTAPSKTYGDATAQASAQRAIPLPQTPPVTAPPAAAQAPAQAPAPAPAPPEAGLLGAPTTRPGEPVTAGLPMGAGPGPEVLGMPAANDQLLANLYRAFQLAPSESLRAMIDKTERLNGPGVR